MTALARAAEVAYEPGTLVQVAQVVNLAVLSCAVIVLVRRRRTQRGAATTWALAMFADFALVVAAGFFPTTDDGSALRHAYITVLICVLLLVPYLLVQFAYALGAVGRRTRRLATALTFAQLAGTLVLPRFPQPGEPRSGIFVAWILLVLVAWTTQSLLSAIGLWSAGKGQPSVVRYRMRALSIGAVVMALSLVASSASNDPGSTSKVITTLVGVSAICLLVLAFVVPTWLRAAWRATDLVEFGAAERAAMTAVTPEEVATAVVPAVVQLFGASGAALLDAQGRPLAAQGLSQESLAHLRARLTAHPAPTNVTKEGVFASRLTEGWLVVQGGTFAPVFGAEEQSLLDRVGSFVDLALQRCRLFEQEALSRRAAEAAAAELQTLIYSVSHDLRNPIISVLGYLDVLTEEHAGQLHGEGEHYLQRISVNAIYMQHLIQDLLELSRIGRSEPASRAVSFGALAESVAQEVRVSYPHCDISVAGPFPVLWMSELRARQLLTNLIDNAAKHAHGEATVVVQALPDGNGGALVLVSDNGNGIPEHHRDKAFEVFERLAAAHTGVAGTGMGLPICKRIVEALDGTIQLDGPPPGATTGTTVRVCFPGSIVQGWTTTSSELKEQIS